METNLFLIKKGLIAFKPNTTEHPLIPFSLNSVAIASLSCSHGSAHKISHNAPCFGVSTNLLIFDKLENFLYD